MCVVLISRIGIYFDYIWEKKIIIVIGFINIMYDSRIFKNSTKKKTFYSHLNFGEMKKKLSLENAAIQEIVLLFIVIDD